MSALEFGAFYEAVHGKQAFPWQKRLAAEIVTNGWPYAIAVPTGCGKTSVMDAAVFALAEQAGLPPGKRTPLRIFFIIDRRLVVDDVYAHAVKLANSLANAKGGVVADVADSLRRFGNTRPLEVAALRGGMYRNEAWADTPNQPVICVSTVDQVGSRLLFRGYGVSDQRRPVEAGLVGNDSLFLVDEAHLSQPFLETVRWVQKYEGEGWWEEQVAPGVRLVEMSATVRRAGAFHLEEDDLRNATLAKRLEASKVAELKETGNLTVAATEEALAFSRSGAGVTAVVVNTVAGARRIFESVKSAGMEALLLTGRVRPYDRDRLLEKYRERIKAGRERREGESLIVVATQTVEVGADLDFDVLVTEAAPLDALRQRFGRLDRLGQLGSTRAVVLKPKTGKEPDRVYGDAVEVAWKWLVRHATAEGERRSIDFGLNAMGAMWQADADATANSAVETGPLMFPAHVDAWAQTSPEPAADPDVAPFLHGRKATEAADVQLVWRADLEDADPVDWPEILAAAPPLSTEALPLPLWAAKRWLRWREADFGDIEGIGGPDVDSAMSGERVFRIWRGPDDTSERRDPRPGDTIVVRSSAGGCDEFGWNAGATAQVEDVGDYCANRRAAAAGGRYRIRVKPLFLSLRDGELRERFQEALTLFEEEDDISQFREQIEAAVRNRPDLERAAELVHWGKPQMYGEGLLLLESAWQKPATRAVGERPEEPEGDEASETREILLREHTEGVAAKARAAAAACGLSETITKTIASAARRHDLGKWDDRFQLLLSNRAPDAEPLAKGEKGRAGRRRREMAGYPAGARHEFASVALAEAGAGWIAGEDSDLALYLIGTHHGHGRPFPPAWDDDPEFEITALMDGRRVTVKAVHRMARLDSGWAERYWRLTRKYGWWGLAYLEAVLRRADCVRSREEEGEK